MRIEEIKKVPVGVDVIPTTYDNFKKVAGLYKINHSQLLNMMIYRRDKEGFTYYSVDPEYGKVAGDTSQTIFYLTEQNRELIQEWANREKCSLTSMVRCLMDISVNKMIERAREERRDIVKYKQEQDKRARIDIFDDFEQHGINLEGYLDECLKTFKTKKIRAELKGYTPPERCLFDFKIKLTDKQLKRLQSIANRQNIDIENVKIAFELFLLGELVTQSNRFCHVPKKQNAELKVICQEMGTTTSKLFDDKVSLLLQEKYFQPEPEDDELQRVNFLLREKTIIMLQHYANTHKMKLAGAVRVLMNCCYNFYEQEGIHIDEKLVF